MIRKLTIENFRALKSVRVELRPLTVLVGPNDSGKTSFIEAIDRKLRRAIQRDEDWWRGSDPADVRAYMDSGTDFTGTAEIFKLPSDGIPMDSVGLSDQGRGAPWLETTGGNLAAFLDYLLRKDRSRFDEIQASLRQQVPGLESISISTPSPDSRSLTLTIEGGYEIPGRRLSTGVRMMFFFVALAHHPNPPNVVLIEEPENGVHPRRLKDIVALLRGLTEGQFTRHPVQVVLTTHSPYLLDQIRPPEDQVIVFRRESDGRRTAEPVDAKHLRAFLDEFMLGEVWFNQGEEGLVKSAQ